MMQVYDDDGYYSEEEKFGNILEVLHSDPMVFSGAEKDIGLQHQVPFRHTLMTETAILEEKLTSVNERLAQMEYLLQQQHQQQLGEKRQRVY